MGQIIDLKDKLRLQHLANELAKDLGLPIGQIEEMGGSVELAANLLNEFSSLPDDGKTSTIEEDHKELFLLLRAR
jgi:hypothetical protein